MTGYTPDGVGPLLALVTYYGEACEDGDDERAADLYGQIAAWLRANQLAPKVDYTPNKVIDLAMRWRDAWAKADREDTRQAWDQANELLDRLRVVISGLLRRPDDAAIDFGASCLGCAQRLSDEAEIRADERAQLSVAGRLLPEDTRTIITEDELDWRDRCGEDHVVTYEDYDDANPPFDLAEARARGNVLLAHRRRTIRQFTDGSTLVGPWVPVPCPDELCGADGGRCPTCGIDAYTAAGVPVPSEPPGEPVEVRPESAWMCGAQHAVRPCTSRNPHRSRSCGWRPAQTPEEPRRG